ncbi:prolyl-tRNA synthetase associated domain-containing protein 1-like [Dendronephthya gigantea]|uniref:prolyl-tRNA synthetase associated domain-containing protein 1-like n=1 Tax=Dendronephthya gigantea TaxID=151771 RepID=UPI00106907C9|nr:prolyl-tRNA synthetase associated domain-containing protein 1-like [Dendronephthya gigantea]
MSGGRAELMNFLENEGITTETIEHPEVFTVETMMEHLKDVNGAVGKNLFLKDKKKKLWLLTTLHDREIDLKVIAKKVGAPGGLRFADESILQEKLGVSQGCVTPLAIFNDHAGDVKVILDSGFFNGNHERCFFHPMVNSASTGLTPDDLKKFIKATGHEAILIDF